MNKQTNSIKYELKQELIEYFEGIQFEIDTHGQQALSKLTQNDEVKRQSILTQNEEMISLVKDTLNSNVTKINEYEFEISSFNQSSFNYNFD